MKKITYKKYEAMGFIESLIAIIVVGVASVVLMQIAASAMSDAVENERIDKMTQYAIEGATMTENIVQELYENGTVSELSNFEGWFSPESCFIPIPDPNPSNPGKFTFKLDSSTGNFKYYPKSSMYSDGSVIQTIKDNAQIVELKGVESVSTDYFRLACIKPKTSTKYLSVTIIVGHIPSKGTVTARRNVKDYSYSTIINL